LAKGDIARLTMSYAKKSCRCILSYSPGGSTRREVVPWGAFGAPILGEREVVGDSDAII